MAGPQHRTPEYRAAYRNLKAAQARGEWLVCVQPVCVMGTRDIAPHEAIDTAHDDSGTVVLGASHMRCNRVDGAVRGNRKRAGFVRRRVL